MFDCVQVGCVGFILRVRKQPRDGDNERNIDTYMSWYCSVLGGHLLLVCDQQGKKEMA